MSIRLFVQGHESQIKTLASPGGSLYQTEFVSVSPMSTARCNHTATTLQDGKVLITGGDDNLGTTYNTAEIYDPSSRSFTALANLMSTARTGHAATLLNSGKVLITGGYNSIGGQLNSAEVYDPISKTFTPSAGNMTSPRQYHTSNLLQAGTVLVAGGFSAIGVATSSADLYDPIANTFAATLNPMTDNRVYQAASTLQNGSVLITGGGSNSSANLNTGEVYDPVAQTFTSVPNTMSSRRRSHVSTVLNDGGVLITGGPFAPATADVYSVSENLFGLTGTPIIRRTLGAGSLLSNGQVVTMGGVDANTLAVTSQADLYSPNSGTFAATNTIMSSQRSRFPIAVLQDGTVLVPGGVGIGGSAINATELFILNQVAPVPAGSINVEITGPNYGSLVVTSRPVDYGALGSYRISPLSGTMAAGMAAGSEVLQVRWTETTNIALIWGMNLNGLTGTATVFTPGFGYMATYMARSYTSDGTGGSVITPAANQQMLRSSMGSSLMESIRRSTTAALGPGTEILDAQPFSQLTFSVGNVAGGIYIQNLDIFGNMEIGANPAPIVLAQNEGIVLIITMPALGTWRWGCSMAWSEVASY